MKSKKTIAAAAVTVAAIAVLVSFSSCEKEINYVLGNYAPESLTENEKASPNTGIGYEENKNNTGKVYEYEFTADLSEYEKYMEPEKRDEYLVLINIDNMLDKDYAADDLIDVVNTRSDREPRKMRVYAEKALEALFIEMNTCGYTDVSVTSAYRSYAEQTYSFNTRLASYSGLSEEEAYRRTSEVIAVPGASEHQSGLCCDMHNLPAADISFEEKAAAKWLAENCYKFGFILRYPKDKTEITKISYEPWHFRYVGRYHASRMHELGMCLEEYCDMYYSQK